MKLRTACILFLTLVLIGTTGCADKTIAMIEEARHEQELAENALELQDVPPETDTELDESDTTAPVPEDQPIAVPFLDKDGGGDFNATPRELVYTLNLLSPENPFEHEEQLRYSSYRYTNEDGIMLCTQLNSTTLHPNTIVIAGAANDPHAVTEVQRISALIFRMVNENTSAQHGNAFLEAMEATSATALPKSPIVKYSETMTYETGVYNNIYYLAVSALPAQAISINYDSMFAINEPEPEPEEEPVIDDGSIASETLGNMHVKVMSARGGVTKNGVSYIGITLTVTNNGVVEASFANSCYMTATQLNTELEELTFVSQEKSTLTPIPAGETLTFDVFFKCNDENYSGISLRIKALMGAPDTQIHISF